MGTSPKYMRHHCSRCGKMVDNLNREEQDQHEIDCNKQEKLF